MKKRKRYLLKIRERFSLKIYNGFLLVAGVLLIAVFFAWSEEYQVLVAGTAVDSVVISLTVADIISISTPANVTMAPDIFGAGISTGEATWEVITNNLSGWKLELEASTSPAMQINSSVSFADYTEASDGVPEAWSVTANDGEFGFSAEGTYSLNKYSSGTLFEGFSGATKIKIAEDNQETPVGGASTTVNFKAEVGSSRNQPAGDYSATITATATTL